MHVRADMKTGLISEASGSAYVESGKIKLSAGVYALSNHFLYHEKNYIHAGDFLHCRYGPRQAARREGYQEQARLYCDLKFCTLPSTPPSTSSTQTTTPAKSSTTTTSSVHTAVPNRRRERELSQLIQQALAPAVRLAQCPKCTIDICIQVLESDGLWSTVAAAICAASLALCDAGVEMVDLVSAVALVHYRL